MDVRYYLMKKINQNIPDELNMFDIHDPLSIDWSKFKFTGKEFDYMLSKYDIERPDILSNTYYNSVIYQNIIFLLNNIGDIFNTDNNSIIKLPKINDLKRFITDNKHTEV